ncbi:MAG: alpha/beta fold hydrolase [Burkholderiaceae bacterium]|nr:alpha/beta fold hydrolase [Burkholderiaceae bacterium]
MILYLHGFRSSPQSSKARLLGDRMQALGLGEQYLCPQLPASPRLAVDLARDLMRPHSPEQTTLIGSSLGGFYACWLAEQTGCPAVLLNPAVKTPLDLEQYVGVSTNYHNDEVFEFKCEYVDELKAYTVEAVTRPERYFLIAATGDEVLDWRDMTAHYAGARQRVIQGSDHGIAEFADYADEVLAFCGVKTK